MDCVHFVTDRKGHDRRYAINNAKIRTELGWEAPVHFEKVLKESVINIAKIFAH